VEFAAELDFALVQKYLIQFPAFRNLYRMLLAPHPVLRENIPLEAQPQTVAE